MFELSQAIMTMNTENKVYSAIREQDTNFMMLQMFQKMQEAMADKLAHDREKSPAQANALALQMEAIAKKVGTTSEANSNGSLETRAVPKLTTLKI